MYKIGPDLGYVKIAFAPSTSIHQAKTGAQIEIFSFPTSEHMATNQREHFAQNLNRNLALNPAFTR